MNEIKVHVLKWGSRKNWYMQFEDPMTGKRERRTTGKAKRSEATKVAGQWESELNSGAYQKTSRWNWQQFVDAYQDEVFPKLSASAQSTRDTVFNHLERIFAPKSLAVIADSRVLSEFQSKLRKEGKSESTIHAYLSHLKSVLNWARNQNIIKTVPKLHLPKLEDDELMRGRAITDAEFQTMLASVPLVRKRGDAAQWQAFLRGLWLSGLRLKEALTLSWDKDEPFRIDTSGLYPQFRIPPKSQKSRKGQLVPIAPDFWEWLTKNTPMEQRTGHVLKLRSLGRDMNASGQQLSEKRACRTISDIGRKADIQTNEERDEHASAHDLRRSFGLRWKKRVKPYELQKMMRHSKIETTLKYYASEAADDLSAGIWAENSSLGDTSGDTCQSGHPSGHAATSKTP